MVRDLSDPYDARRRQARDVRRLQASTAIQNTAVDRGALRVKSAEGLEVGTAEDPTGSQYVYGILRIIGRLIGDGQITWSGPWRFTGNGAITGDVVAEGKWTQNGPWEFNGDGDIAGDVDVTGDLEVLGGGRIKVGNVIITPGSGGKVTVGTGSARVVLDGATGKITAGDVVIDPTDNSGSVLFGTGSGAPKVTSAPDGIAVTTGDATATVRGDAAWVGTPDATIGVQGEDIVFTGVPTSLPTGVTARYLAWGSDNNVYALSGVGGGGSGIPGPVAGDYMWPFPQSTTHPVLGIYGMRLNPATGVWAMHLGRDFTVPGGSAIPAIGDGTVAAVSSGDARGNRIRIDHGGGLASEYFHMMSASPLSVGTPVLRGDTIGYVGTTGSSTGNHLHLQIWQGGGWVDPTAFFIAQESIEA